MSKPRGDLALACRVRVRIPSLPGTPPEEESARKRHPTPKNHGEQRTQNESENPRLVPRGDEHRAASSHTLIASNGSDSDTHQPSPLGKGRRMLRGAAGLQEPSEQRNKHVKSSKRGGAGRRDGSREHAVATGCNGGIS